MCTLVSWQFSHRVYHIDASNRQFESLLALSFSKIVYQVDMIGHLPPSTIELNFVRCVSRPAYFARNRLIGQSTIVQDWIVLSERCDVVGNIGLMHLKFKEFRYNINELHGCNSKVLYCWQVSDQSKARTISSETSNYPTDKLQNLSETSRFAWVFWLGLRCVVCRQVTFEKMPQLWWSI